jgi:transcription elongation factor GreA
MTTQTSLVPPKIGQVRDAFVRSDPSRRLGPDDLAKLRKFVTWCGVSTSMEAIPPFKIEEFLGAQTNTSQPPRLYMPALKAFFAFALEQGLVESDPMRAVRLPRGAGSATKRSTSATPGAPPRAPAPSPTPSINGDAPDSGAGAGGVSDEVVYVSREHLGAMQTELERLKNDERHRISQMLHEAIKDGDLSENAAYDDAKMRQGLLEARIRDLESKVRHAEIIEDQVGGSSGVGVGSNVRLVEVASGDQLDYQVVGPEETNPRGGKISHRSPERPGSPGNALPGPQRL